MSARAFSALLCAASTTLAAQAPAITQHTVRIGSTELHYTAEASWTPITGDSSTEVHGRIYATAYLVAGANRPVTFVWNGGPGASSTFLHFLGFGPELLDSTKFRGNPDTPLPVTDLVFVDPAGTGFSRPASAEFAKDFFSTTGDAKSVTKFILAWLKAHHAERRPVFLMGESFGGYRAGGVTERLESQGHRVAGVILVSGGVASGPLVPPDVRTALVTPQRAAAALVLGKSAPELGTDRTALLREATQWSLETYLPALVHRDVLTDAQRDTIIAALHRFTGFPADKIDRKTLAIGFEYLSVMSPVEGKTLSPFDMRTTDIREFDPATVDHYFRVTLGVKTDLAYWDAPGASDSLRPGEKNWVWDYRWPESEKYGTNFAEPWLPHAMAIDPHIKVFVAAGLYDMLNSCAENDVIRGVLQPDLAPNYTMMCYPGGHMIYRDPAARVTLSRDVKRFITERVREP